MWNRRSFSSSSITKPPLPKIPQTSWNPVTPYHAFHSNRHGFFLLSSPNPSIYLGRARAYTLAPCTTYCTIRAALGTNPASFSVLPKSIEPSNVFRGKFMTNRVTATPSSDCSSCATSNSVVSAGRVFMTFPPGVCRRRRASLCVAAGLAAAGAGAGAGVEEEEAEGTALPSRAAFASSALRRRSSLSASIFALIRRFASRSSSFSWRFFAASLICSFRAISSFRSCDSLVAFWRICCGGGRGRAVSGSCRGKLAW